MIKKILLCVCLFLCGVIQAEEVDKKWFIGVEGGVGLYDLGLSVVMTLTSDFMEQILTQER